jgi:hypothetical protein
MNHTSAGTPKAIKAEDGSLLDMNAVIRDTLTDDAHVWVLIRGTLCSFFFLAPRLAPPLLPSAFLRVCAAKMTRPQRSCDDRLHHPICLPGNQLLMASSRQ